MEDKIKMMPTFLYVDIFLSLYQGYWQLFSSIYR